MIRHLLDTDTTTLYQWQHPKVVANIRYAPAGTVGHAAVTAAEQIEGRLAEIKRARTPEDIAACSGAFAVTVRFFADFELVPMTVGAVLRFRGLLALKLNVGGNDLRIAATALDIGATVVSRNVRDFGRVPGLNVVDWSV